MKNKSLIALSLTLILTGCAVGPDYQKPTQTLDDSYQTLGEGLTNDTAKEQWWRQFNDPLLNRYVDEALNQNLNLKIAMQRVQMADSYRKVVASQKVPTVALGAGYGGGMFSESGPIAGPLVTDNNPLGMELMDRQQDGFRVGADIAWEADIFKRIDRQVDYAEIRKSQSEIVTYGVQLMVISQVVDNYIQLRGAQERLVVAEQNIDDQKQLLARIEKLKEAGLAGDLEIAQAKGLLASVKAIKPMLETAIDVHQYRLAIILAQQPQALKDELAVKHSHPLPKIEGLIPVGLPSDLLLRRPDIQFAERDMAAKNAKQAIAVANKYPRFYLTGSPGTLGGNFGDLFSNGSGYWTAMAGFEWTIFDGGRKNALKEAADADFVAAEYRYQRSWLNALGEVETLLSAYSHSQDSLVQIKEALDASHLASEKAQLLYKSGMGGYISVLDAQRTEYSIRDRYIASQVKVSQSAASLSRALGGGWKYQPPMKS
ncbi:TolC family protein (plasmid) [Vibrio sp. SS-MA-C1-2]|uniref:efflux transporter outer membrane subunit n=1 Tax=Vibrio sp. SS-MA-C1-2 TaxID=2908646 RepID=UPI001F337778|nr:TolC family protein [Vibrio sp. SS-MA-C1-2]UJF20293.1 TolC family protein [Vibrio sp. SS-MA-C1-2]